MATKLATLKCLVKVIKNGAEADLGAFQMIEKKAGVLVGGQWHSGFFFDYQALAEELVNRRLVEDEAEAAMACEYVEYHLNEGNDWKGQYEIEDEGVVVSYSVEPDAVKTEDGYVFTRLEDGSYSDGDMSWDSFDDFRETCEVEWVPTAERR